MEMGTAWQMGYDAFSKNYAENPFIYHEDDEQYIDWENGLQAAYIEYYGGEATGLENIDNAQTSFE
jgi:hypothetical protein